MKKTFFISLLKKILIIRNSEDIISKYYSQNEMKTPMHMSKGEELVVSVAVLTFLKNSDFFGYYRSHALYLSATEDLKSFFGEMYGKVIGENKGITGSMHIFNPKKNIKLVSAIVASTIAPAVGSAYANLIKKNNRFTVSFFGDGATEEGVFWESMNFSCLKKIPIIFICLNNKIAVDVMIKERQSYKINEIVKKFNLKTYTISSFDILKICKVYNDASNYIKKHGGPIFIEANYYRQLQHIGVNDDFNNASNNFEKKNYRSRLEHKFYAKKDPYLLIKKFVLEKKLISLKKLNSYEDNLKLKLEKIIKLVKKSKILKNAASTRNVYYENK
jgi:pyruvate dehydrogenase E1 component alpha subunit